MWSTTVGNSPIRAPVVGQPDTRKEASLGRTMQSDQRQGNSSSSRRRRRRVEVCSQLLLPVVAAAGMCLSGSHLVADAFVAPSTPPITWSPRNSLRLSSEAATPPLSIDSVYGRQRSMSMVIRESPSAACRRALQRAWQATPSEATSHETVSVLREFVASNLELSSYAPLIFIIPFLLSCLIVEMLFMRRHVDLFDPTPDV